MDNGNFGAMVMVMLILIALIGYGWNVIRIAQTKSLTGLTMLRIIGVFLVPLGCLLGFISNAPEETKK